jgi:hypothetical protein
MTTTTGRKSVWMSCGDRCYTHDLSNGRSPQSTGGVVITQVRFRAGQWEARQVQSNGRHVFAAKPYAITEQEARQLSREAL